MALYAQKYKSRMAAICFQFTKLHEKRRGAKIPRTEWRFKIHIRAEMSLYEFRLQNEYAA